jgi:hypothetical protein
LHLSASSQLGALLKMNSCFHGSAVTQRSYYCNPVTQILDAETGVRSKLEIQGRKMNQVDENKRKFCLTERDRFAQPYIFQPMRHAPKTIFTPTIPTNVNGTVIQKPVKPKTKQERSLIRQ